MKEIYVYKRLIGGWVGISKEEAESKIQEGSVYGAQLEMDRGEGDNLKITLLKDNLGFYRSGDKEIQQLTDEYLQYVEEITGMVSYPAQ